MKYRLRKNGLNEMWIEYNLGGRCWLYEKLVNSEREFDEFIKDKQDRINIITIKEIEINNEDE